MAIAGLDVVWIVCRRYLLQCPPPVLGVQLVRLVAALAAEINREWLG